MAVLFSLAYLVAIFVSGTLGSYYLEGLYKPQTARYVEKHFNELDPWERELWDHRNDPRWLQISHLFKQHDQRHVHSGSVKARRKPGVPTRRADQTWSREEHTSRRLPGYIPRRDEGPLKVFPNGHRRTVPLAKDEFSANDLWLLMPDDAGWNKGKARADLLKGNSGPSEPGVGENENGTPEKEGKSEADITTAKETDITETESSEVEETWTTSDLDKVDDTVQTVEESESTSQATKETVSTARSTVDPKDMLPSTTTFLSSGSEIVSSSTSTVEDTTSPSMTTFPFSEVTARKTVSTTPSTARDSSSEGISPSNTPVPSSTVTASETVSSTPSTASDSSSEGTSPSTSTVTASETVSPTPSTTGGSSSSPVPDHVIVLPRIRTARIVLSSVLLAVGLVAVAVAAVCIFRERRRKLKYDQLKLLP